METTKYMRAYENFDNAAEDKAAEIIQPSIVAGEIIAGGDFFCVISSYNPGNDPAVLDEEHDQLMKDVLKMKYAYLEMKYGYQYSDGKGLNSITRKSLLVPLMNYQELLTLGRKYNQETVAFGGAEGGITVVRVSDQKVVLTMKTEEMHLAWNFLLTNQRNIPW